MKNLFQNFEKEPKIIVCKACGKTRKETDEEKMGSLEIFTTDPCHHYERITAMPICDFCRGKLKDKKVGWDVVFKKIIYGEWCVPFGDEVK